MIAPTACQPAPSQPWAVDQIEFETAYFLFAGVAFTLILRRLQGRPLWDRVFVGRTLVIGDAPYVKNLLSQYVSKLFSLAYEFAGFAGIHAADMRIIAFVTGSASIERTLMSGGPLSLSRRWGPPTAMPRRRCALSACRGGCRRWGIPPW